MYNIRFIALTDNIDTLNSDSASMDMLPIMNVFNEWHAANTSKKLKAVFDANARAGKYTCTFSSYGYFKGDDEKRTPVIDPATAPIVRRIFEMRAKGYTPMRIADVLNAEKILTPSDYQYQLVGKPNPHYTYHLWNNSSVRNILRNPIYLGQLRQLRKTTVSYKNHKVLVKDEADWAVIEHNHEPIISQELWDKCREVDASMSRSKPVKSGVVLPLTGLMYCDSCGSKMRFHGSGRSTGSAYVCGMHSRAGKNYCSSHSITERLIESAVLSDIQSMIDIALDEDRAKMVFFERKAGMFAAQTAEDKKRKFEVEHRIAELDNLIQNIYEDKVSGKIAEDVCIRLIDKYQKELKSLQTECDELQKRTEAERQDERDVNEYIRRLKSYSGAEELTRQMCMDLIEYITIDENPRNSAIPRRIHVYYKFIDKPLKNKNNALEQ